MRKLSSIVAFLLLCVSCGFKPPDKINVLVDTGSSFVEMVRDGHYNQINPEVTIEHFPIQGESGVKELVLFHLNKEASTDAVLTAMRWHGLKPSPIEDILALGAAYPGLQLQFPMVAFGSSWEDPDGHHYFPCLGRYSVKRHLDICPQFDWFGKDYRFLAVRK